MSAPAAKAERASGRRKLGINMFGSVCAVS